MSTRNVSTSALIVAAALTAACGSPTPPKAPEAAATPSASPAATSIPTNPLKEAYFGEQHLHTAYSLDAYLGGTRLTPSDAYRFAKGEEVEVNGSKVKLHAPLDWAAVTDHAEYLGEMYSTMVAGAPGHDNPQLQELRRMTSYEDREKWFVEYVQKANRGTTPQHAPFYAGPETAIGGWKVVLAAAAEHYKPGTFTTIPAFEWSAAPEGGNLHRNVFFRDTNVPERPMSYVDINREEALWSWMAGLEKQGMKVIAIPHNSNASKGTMFSAQDSKGDPLTLEYAEMRSRFEPLIEMMQIKGNSEVHRWFWAADEFADFENADSLGDYSGRNLKAFGKQNWVRWGLIKGLAHQKSLGVNPYHYGIVGGTDTHNGTPSNVDEDNFAIGSHGSADGTVERRRTSEIGGWLKGKDLNPGALTGVWAPQNTREAIWDAMKARETFATSGPRLKVRFFGRLGAMEKPADARRLVESGYAQGVPMGGTLKADASAAAGATPSFTVWAMKGPDDANLDRIQIVKGWVDAEGEPQDRVFDVAWSGDRKPGKDGKVPAVGNTVDVTKAVYTNAIGSAELMGTWTDPSFDPAQGAVYYVRVLQIPTPRWSTYDAVRAGVPLLPGVPATVQERAWSSPIWYTPTRGKSGAK
ncbi:DUF3604 domain-containing protein [Luteitalea sp.]|jgi:hypothetical protein|uniref:DUF3604 domain-containing protein n=1 Tax=Luteitalea sp. TaxID=2004800 RepID=UPI0037CA7682